MSVEFRDPVHGTLTFSTAETAIIDTPEFQRLRAIKQLGFADVSFPGATHSRFLHSLGVSHLAGRIFDAIFEDFGFSKNSVRNRLRQVTRLGALLHDVGHGPLSHTTEDVMPLAKDLKIDAYESRSKGERPSDSTSFKTQRATHEDYTIKYLTDSALSKVIKSNFSDISPLHIAALIDRSLNIKDDFFVDQGLDFRPILSQIVSSELDADRMDYLERDSYFTGTSYGKIDRDWLIAHMKFAIHKEKLYLALNRRALYTFDDFMLSRHHIHLMVYFHHKPIIFEEMLNLYLLSKDCDFALPADINEYTRYNDFRLYEHLAESKNEWAQRISQRKPYQRLMELHGAGDSARAKKIIRSLQDSDIHCIWSSSKARLSKYHADSAAETPNPIYVLDQFDKLDKPTPINKSTEVFQKYEGTRVIDRIYVAPETFKKAEKILAEKPL